MRTIDVQGKPRQPSRQERRSEQTRAKILEAASAVFAERGLSAATVDEITERADVGRGSFYYHFKTMDNLIQHMVGGVLDDLIAHFRRRCDQAADLESTLSAMISAHIEFFERRWEDFVLYYQGRAELILDKPFGGLETPYVKYIRAIESQIARTNATPIEPARMRRLASALAGFVSGYYSLVSLGPVGGKLDDEFGPLRNAVVRSLARFARHEKRQVSGPPDSETAG